MSDKRIPSIYDISPTVGGHLDEKSAITHFLGKSQSEAQELFHTTNLLYEEDLLYMGEYAFEYYFAAFHNYLTSTSAYGNSSAVQSVITIAEYRINVRGERWAWNLIKPSVLFCIDNYKKFDVDEEIYGSQLSRLEDLLKHHG